MNIEIPVPDGLEPIALKQYRLPWAKTPHYQVALYFEDTPDRFFGLHQRELWNGNKHLLDLGLVEIINREAYNGYLDDGVMGLMAQNYFASTNANAQTRGMMRHNLLMLQRNVREQLIEIVSAIVGEYEISDTIEPVNDLDERYMVVVTGGVDKLYYAGEYDPILFELMRKSLRKRFEQIQKENF